jgi:hypothetical protein
LYSPPSGKSSCTHPFQVVQIIIHLTLQLVGRCTWPWCPHVYGLNQHSVSTSSTFSNCLLMEVHS